MEYRTLGRTGLRVSAISLGTEYLIDRPRDHVVNVIRHAIERGINYFDLFFAQPAFRDNMGAAFRGHRDDVILTAHLGAIHRDGQYQKTRDLALSEEFFYDYLRRYDTEHVDLLYLHNCDEQEDYDRLMSAEGLLGLGTRLKEEGKARYLAFSGHTPTIAQQAVTSGDIDVLMFPINLAANAMPGKRELFRHCLEAQVGLVAMKPYAGGKLFQTSGLMEIESFQAGGADLALEQKEPPSAVQCLHYVLNQVGVSTIVPGCANVDELEAALAYWQASDAERDYADLIHAYDQYHEGECVYCNHCLPCPSEIDIGQVLRLLDTADPQPSADQRRAYQALDRNASDCIACGACEERCPFGVSVIKRMERAQALFA